MPGLALFLKSGKSRTLMPGRALFVGKYARAQTVITRSTLALFGPNKILIKSAFRDATRGDAPEENGKIFNFL